MSQVFLSYARAGEAEAQRFVQQVVIGYANTRQRELFFSRGPARVPEGSLRDARVFSAEANADIVIIYATAHYFESHYCSMEAGLSLARNDGVYCFLSPNVRWASIPEHMRWFGWRYAHDPEQLVELSNSLTQAGLTSLHRDTKAQESALRHWLTHPVSTSPRARENLSRYRASGPHIQDHTPYRERGSRKQVFGRISWLMDDGSLVPVVWAAADQTSLMNNDSFIHEMQDVYGRWGIFGLWPEDDQLGVTLQTGGSGGTTEHQEQQLSAFGIPLPSDGTIANLRRRASSGSSKRLLWPSRPAPRSRLDWRANWRRKRS